MPTVDDVFPSKYLTASDLRDQECTVTINGYSFEQMNDGQRKPCLTFVGKQKGFVLNVTNARRIALFHGDDLDGWLGKSITLYPDVADFQGQPKPCIRVKAGMVTPVQNTQAPLGQPNGAPDPGGTMPVSNDWNTGSGQPVELDDEIPF